MKKTKRLPMQIQLFAEVEESEEATPKTLDEILQDSYYQSEFDKKVAKANETAVANAIKKARAEWEQEVASQKAESEKLASMDELQKKDYELENLRKENEAYKQKEEANKLMSEAIKQATEKGIPLEIMTALDYTKETADSVNSKIEVYAKTFQSVKSNVIAEYSKESAPQTGDYKGTEKDISKMTYEELCQLPEFQK